MHGGPWACSKRALCCSAFALLTMAGCAALSTTCTTRGCTRRGVLLAQELGDQTAGSHVCAASSIVMTPSANSHVLRHGTVAVTEAVGLGQNASACTLHGGQTCASVWAARACNARGQQLLARFNKRLGARPPNGCDSVAVSLCGSCRAPVERATPDQGKVALCLSNPLFGPSLSPAGLRWMGLYLDHYRALGASHAFLYRRAREAQQCPALNTALNVTWVELAFATRNLWYNGQIWAINDCVQRAASQGFSWALTVDVDEVLVLARSHTLGEFVANHGAGVDVFYFAAIYRAERACLEGARCTRSQMILPPRNEKTDAALRACLRAIPSGLPQQNDTIRRGMCQGGHGRVLKHLVRLGSAVVAGIHDVPHCFAPRTGLSIYAARECQAFHVRTSEGWLQHVPGGAELGRPTVEKKVGWTEGRIGVGGGAGKTDATLPPVCSWAGRVPGWEVGRGRILQKQWSLGATWGNALTRYWTPRMVAWLGGLSYRLHRNVAARHNQWADFLPEEVAAVPQTSVMSSQLLRFCHACGPNGSFWAKSKSGGEPLTHHCYHGWPQFLDIVGNDTRHAIHRYAESHSIQLWRPAAQDWVLYDRCEFGSRFHGPHGFSLYDSIPCDDGVTLWSWTSKEQLCRLMQASREAYLKKRCGKWRLASIDSGKTRASRDNMNNMSSREESLKDHGLFRDFARLVVAPHVIVNGAGSSWAFYSAVAAAPHVIFGDADEGHIEALASPPRRTHVSSPVYHAAKSKIGRSVVVHVDAFVSSADQWFTTH